MSKILEIQVSRVSWILRTCNCQQPRAVAHLFKADAPEDVSPVVVPHARVALVAVGRRPAGPSAVLGGHVAVVLPWVTEVLEKRFESRSVKSKMSPELRGSVAPAVTASPSVQVRLLPFPFPRSSRCCWLPLLPLWQHPNSGILARRTS